MPVIDVNIMLTNIIIPSIVVSIIAITQTIKAEQIIPTADIDNYSPKLSSSFANVKQLKPPMLHATNTTNINSILITTTTKIQPKTLLMPAAQKLMMITDEIAIIEAKPSAFNNSSLQQQYQKQKQQVDVELATTTTTTTTKSAQAPKQRHYKYAQYTFNNKHPPCDYKEHNAATSSIVNENINSISISIGNGVSNLSKAPQIDATAKGYKPLVITSNSVDIGAENNDGGGYNGSIAAFSSSSTTPTTWTMTMMPLTTTTMTTATTTATTTTAFNVARNGFRDKINISNQRNEFSNVDDDSNYDYNYNYSNELFDDAVAKVQQQQQYPLELLHRKYRHSSTTTTTTTATANAAVSSFFERAELLESNLSPDEHHELLLHRRKRYLVFPEGSSFQLVFDLIIGIVDYTSYAILGITCSVAWELPSKPPSEIIENFRDKLNDGSFGLQRRNDTIANEALQYVDTNNNKNISNITQIVRTATPKTKTAASTKFANFENNENAWKPQFAVFNYYNKPTPIASSYNKGSNTGSSNIGSGSYFKTVTDTSGLSRTDDVDHNNDDNDDDVDGFASARGDNFAVKTQRKTLNEKAPSSSLLPIPSTLQQSNWYKNYAKLKANTKYYNNNENNYKNVWNFNDKQKYAAVAAATADWHQQQQQQQYQHQHQHQHRLHASSSSSNSNTDEFLDNVDASENDDYMPDRFGPYQRKQQTNYAGPWQQKDNWWQRNKQRLQTKWQRKQQAWSKYTKQNDEPTWSDGYMSKRPVTEYARPIYNNNGNAYERTGRQRKILTKPPKHRIYPVFGRRKRSLTYEEQPLTAFDVQMERIHFREQLESRQKLFGKIEQVFKTRGHNGTECVLRALCETGQRQQQLYHHNHNQHHHNHHHHHQHHQQQQQQPHSTAGQHREPQSFITELLRAIFALPKDIGDVDALQRGKRSYDAGTQSASATTQSDLEFELQRHQQREFESQIPGHYRAAHTYAGNCALRFAGCELSIWEDVALFDNGFGFANDAEAEADATGRRTFKM